MMPTIESMKMIGMPASVSATKITPRAISWEAPTSSRRLASPQTAAPMTRPPTSASAASRKAGRPAATRRVAPAATADR